MMTLKFDAATTALVLVDLQNSNAARQLAPHPASLVIANAARLAATMRERGVLIVYVRVAIAEIPPANADRSLPRPAAPPPAEACDIVAAAGMLPGDVLITKRQWGAFYGTELDQLLRRRGVRTIVLGGIATNFGVESTARAAFDRNFDLIFIEDAMSTLSADLHAFCVTQTFPLMGKVRSTEALLAELA
jgi:nicotinamidase-related amidase